MYIFFIKAKEKSMKVLSFANKNIHFKSGKSIILDSEPKKIQNYARNTDHPLVYICVFW